MSRAWTNEAVKRINADFQRSADTHLIKLILPHLSEINIYLKDESTHPTGSLKHRLARSLFLLALCNGRIDENSTIIEASSGSTAVSEAYFARLLGLPFIAVVPASTARKKLEKIEFYGGRCHLVNQSSEIYAESKRLARELNGYYMDQFTNAERATDWRGNNNIAEAIFSQMAKEPHPVPRWIVMSAGTGGTSATIGRYLRYQCLPSSLCVTDPEDSVFFDFYRSGYRALTGKTGSRIEGIGRPRVEPSFIPGVVDTMLRIPDAASVATMQWLETIIGRKAGPSTGTHLYGALYLASTMQRQDESGSIVTLLCDSGERYLDTYYDPRWLKNNIGELSPYREQLEHFGLTGHLPDNGTTLAQYPAQTTN